MKWLPLFGFAMMALVIGAGDVAAREKRHRVATYEPKIICGQTGCFEIPKGCTGEMRRTGRSVVAVVWCDKK